MSAPTEGDPKPRNRRWFVALAWVTLALFAVFVAVIVIGTASIPRLRRPRASLDEAPACREARR